ncbi:MAG: thiamine pyrophosphate-binding protein [Candidatus Ancillula sp.]|jgi:acetolactate synthase-1/2/3 large subunit|nr:thiamine pyrophosphate-binding protein [Candidatus Ancillula sp.]
MRVSDYICEFFKENGVEQVFVVTGGNAMWLNDSAARQGFNITCFHHEQSATIAADAYGRLTRKPAIAMVTAGPGSINALTGVVGGFVDSSPMIVISGQSNLLFVDYENNHPIRQFGVQGINIEPVVKPNVKFFKTVDDPRMIAYYCEKAFFEATTGRPGPVWIDVPLDIQRMEVQIEDLEHYSPESSTKNNLDHAILKLSELLTESNRPLLLAGQAVSLSGARLQFVELAEKLQIPVVTSRLGIDLLEFDNDLFVGHPGNYGNRAANIAVQNADLIVAIGSRMSTATIAHSTNGFGKNAKIYSVDIDTAELEKPYPKIDFRIHSDALRFIEEALSSELPVNINKAWLEKCKNLKLSYPDVPDSYEHQKDGINTYWFTHVLSKVTPADSAVVVDTGSCFHVAAQAWKLKKGQSFLTTGGLSTMGWWPACIGAADAFGREKEIICITGDGSLQMNLQELAQLKYHNLPVKLFIFNNNGYLLIRTTQHTMMNDNFFGEGPQTGVWCPDSLEIAKAYGIPSVRIDSTENLASQIEEVLNMSGPVICEVMSQQWQELIPKVTSERMPDGSLIAHEFEDMAPFLPREELEKVMSNGQA